MKIIKLIIENIKKIKAIEIRPKGNTVIISGKNGAGKTCALDSIWFALTGKGSQKETPKPIRDGQDHASVTVDIGDYDENEVYTPRYIVTRNWTSNDISYLKVENAEGAKYPSPEHLLDSLIGELSFDPLEFARIGEKQQKEVLLKLLGLTTNVEKLDGKYQDIFSERTFIGRNYKASKAQLDGIEMPRGTLPENEVNISELTKKLSEAIENNKAIEDLEGDIKGYEGRLVGIEQEIEELLKEKEQAAGNLKSTKEKLNKSKIIPIEDLQDKIDNAQDLNSEIRSAQSYYEKKIEVEKLEKNYKTKTAGLSKITKAKSEIVKNAKMPIEGLSFDDGGVLFKSIPFSQLSAAEQLRVSISMAMAMNPKLRVIRIMDGSLLDTENMEIIKQMADKNDFQIWIEKVDESGKIGIYIEDGEIKEGA
ncbi:DNA replication and repair protein RecF [subsurface metagenome]